MTTYKSIKYNFDGSNITGVLQSPTISSITPSSDTEANLPTTITITGTNFQSNSTVTFIGASGTSILSPSVTFNSVTELDATAPTGVGGVNEDPWDVKVENPVTGQGDNLFTIDDDPIFATPAGTLGTIIDTARAAPGYTLSPATATDPEGVTVSYALVAPGPAVSPGLSFDNTNAAITGTADAVGGDTTTSFTVRATAGAQTSDRIFSITVKSPTTTFFAVSGTAQVTLPFAAPIKILVVAGGGASGGNNQGGGGGGGLINHPSYAVTPQTYNMYIGAGGLTGPATVGQNSNWNSPSSTASTTANILTALGGGTTGPATDGGSGGGSPGPTGLAIQANSPLISADAKTYGFGNNGGASSPAYPHAAGGGGGAGAVGATPSGGAGKDVSTDFGASQGSPGGHFSGGGGGGSHTGGGGPGGTGGGGAYQVAGTPATGGGGGANATGGSGIIGIAY